MWTATGEAAPKKQSSFAAARQCPGDGHGGCARPSGPGEGAFALVKRSLDPFWENSDQGNGSARDLVSDLSDPFFGKTGVGSPLLCEIFALTASFFENL